MTLVSDQATGTACNACGGCCDPVAANFDLDDPPIPDSFDAAESLRFAHAHWTKVGQDGGERFYACDAFDPETRLCTAHDDRPPICRGYPWNGRTRDVLTSLDAVRIRRFPLCEFWADLPPETRPEGWEPVLLTTKPREA